MPFGERVWRLFYGLPDMRLNIHWKNSYDQYVFTTLNDYYKLHKKTSIFKKYNDPKQIRDLTHLLKAKRKRRWYSEFNNLQRFHFLDKSIYYRLLTICYWETSTRWDISCSSRRWGNFLTYMWIIMYTTELNFNPPSQH